MCRKVPPGRPRKVGHGTVTRTGRSGGGITVTAVVAPVPHSWTTPIPGSSPSYTGLPDRNIGPTVRGGDRLGEGDVRTGGRDEEVGPVTVTTRHEDPGTSGTVLTETRSHREVIPTVSVSTQPGPEVTGSYPRQR